MPFLPETVRGAALEQAFRHALLIDDEAQRATALVRLLPHLPPELLTELIEAAITMQDADRCRALVSMSAAYLPAPLLINLLKKVQAGLDNIDRIRTMIQIALTLKGNRRALATRLALDMLETNRFWHGGEDWYLALAPYPTPELLARAIKLLEQGWPSDRSALLRLALQADVSLRHEVLVNLYRRTETLPERPRADSMGHMPHGAIEHWQEQINDIRRLLLIMQRHVGLLPDEVRSTIGERLDRIRDGRTGWWGSNWADDDSLVVLKNTWRLAAVSNNYAESADLTPAKAWEQWRDALTQAEQGQRADVLDTLGNLAPLVAMFAGAEGVKAVLRTIDEATRWFP